MPDISVDLVERFYAILAIAAIGGMILLGTLRILAIQSDPALDAYATIARAIQARGVIAAWFVATLATIGSLFFSEIAKFTPCTLCWYQRIAMYPLVVILGMAMLRRQRRAPTGTVAAIPASARKPATRGRSSKGRAGAESQSRVGAANRFSLMLGKLAKMP